MRKACPWLRTGGVVDHQMVDVAVRDAGTGKGSGAVDWERAFFVTSRKRGVQSGARNLGALDSHFSRE
jgi:hypothetical protein